MLISSLARCTAIIRIKLCWVILTTSYQYNPRIRYTIFVTVNHDYERIDLQLAALMAIDYPLSHECKYNHAHCVHIRNRHI